MTAFPSPLQQFPAPYTPPSKPDKGTDPNAASFRMSLVRGDLANTQKKLRAAKTPEERQLITQEFDIAKQARLGVPADAPGYLQNSQAAFDANARATTESDANAYGTRRVADAKVLEGEGAKMTGQAHLTTAQGNVKYMMPAQAEEARSRGRVNDATAQYAIPAGAIRTTAEGQKFNAEANQIGAMTPEQVQALRTQTALAVPLAEHQIQQDQKKAQQEEVDRTLQRNKMIAETDKTRSEAVGGFRNRDTGEIDADSSNFMTKPIPLPAAPAAAAAPAAPQIQAPPPVPVVQQYPMPAAGYNFAQQAMANAGFGGAPATPAPAASPAAAAAPAPTVPAAPAPRPAIGGTPMTLKNGRTVYRQADGSFLDDQGRKIQ